jgi:hypothetical protein
MNFKQKVPTDKEFREALRVVRREMRSAQNAWDNFRMGPVGDGSKLTDVYAALERAQHAAFDTKELFSLELRGD